LLQILKFNKHSTGPIHTHCLWRSILTRKVGQTDLVFGVWSRFISRSVHARLQSLCAAVMICTTVINIQTDTPTQTAFW